MIKIVADENIIFAREAFSAIGEVKLMPGREIDNKVLKNADALITRSVTRVDAALLKNTNVKFTGTATIGTDHIDLNYLLNNNIAFADAKGCNADAVAEYVFSGIYSIASEKKISIKDLSIGIIGAGNIGSRVARIASAAGMTVKLNDPPLQRETGSGIYLDLDDVLDSDIVTFHVPLTLEGADKTYHLLDTARIRNLKDKCILINSSRGEVIDNNALASLTRQEISTIIDVWENEPFINKELLQKVSLATPHIAGYSLEGKINGTVMIYKAICRHFDINLQWQPEYPEIKNSDINVSVQGTDEEVMNRLISSVYNIKSDDAHMRRLLNMETGESGRLFDKLRRDYPLRRELKNFSLTDKSKKSVYDVFTALQKPAAG